MNGQHKQHIHHGCQCKLVHVSTIACTDIESVALWLVTHECTTKVCSHKAFTNAVWTHIASENWFIQDASVYMACKCYSEFPFKWMYGSLCVPQGILCAATWWIRTTYCYTWHGSWSCICFATHMIITCLCPCLCAGSQETGQHLCLWAFGNSYQNYGTASLPEKRDHSSDPSPCNSWWTPPHLSLVSDTMIEITSV